MTSGFYFTQKNNESKSESVVRIFKENWSDSLIMSIFPYMLAKSLTAKELAVAASSLTGDDLKRFRYYCDIALLFNKNFNISEFEDIETHSGAQPIHLLTNDKPKALFINNWEKFGSDISKTNMIVTIENPDHYLERFRKWDLLFKENNPYLLRMEE